MGDGSDNGKIWQRLLDGTGDGAWRDVAADSLGNESVKPGGLTLLARHSSAPLFDAFSALFVFLVCHKLWLERCLTIFPL
jgi:hypothetical protein